MRLAIADPPYPPSYAERFDGPAGAARLVSRSRARRWYGDGTRSRGERPADYHPDAAEWDDPARHRQLLLELCEQFEGWAIATTPDGVQHYGPLPVGARIMAWVKLRAMPTSARVASMWEAVIVLTPPARRARALDPVTGHLVQVPDVLVCAPPAASFAGAKPPQWTRWVLDAMGYTPEQDELVDLFPGSGMVAAAAAQGVLL